MNEFTETPGMSNTESPDTNVPASNTVETSSPSGSVVEASEQMNSIPDALPFEESPILHDGLTTRGMEPSKIEQVTPPENNLNPENKVSPEEGASEYLRLMDITNEIKLKLEELEEGLKAREENASQAEPTTEVPDEDPKEVVRRMSGTNEQQVESSSEQEPPSVEQIFDNYKQALDQNPTTELPEELEARTEFGQNPNVLDLSVIPTDSEQTDPFVEIDPQSQEKQVVFPFFTREGNLSRVPFEYKPFVNALQEGIQPPNKGTYIKIEAEGKKPQIVKMGGHHFNKIINAIAAVEQQQNTNSPSAQETPPAQEPITPETNQFNHQTPPASEGFGR